MKRLALICLLLFSFGAPAMAAAQTSDSPQLGVGETPELGQFLTDGAGMTLYTFTNDTPGAGTSVCNDDCAANWPPFYVEGAVLPDGVDGDLSVVTRDDGSEQLAFNGWPLYLWVSDTAAGDTTGQGVGDVWYVAWTTDTGREADAAMASPEASPVASSMDAAAGSILVSETAELGQFLTDSEGMTLYIFTNDEADAGTSVCNDDCAVNWPPFYAENASLPEGTPGVLTVITRDDGTEQLAYNGMPLYYFAKDEAPGDTTGHEVGDVWYVAAVGDPEGM